MRKPRSKPPTLAEAKAGNVPEEWREYFEHAMRQVAPDIQRIAQNAEAWKSEAAALFDALHATHLSQAEKYIRDHPPSAGAIAFLILLAEDKFKSEQGVRGARAAHSVHHDKTRQIREIWASGKFATREVCADEEHEALGISRETARKYLRGTPSPNPWPAKKRSKTIT